MLRTRASSDDVAEANDRDGARRLDSPRRDLNRAGLNGARGMEDGADSGALGRVTRFALIERRFEGAAAGSIDHSLKGNR